MPPGAEIRMVNLFDIMLRAQNGAAMDNIARQFGLSSEQGQRAVEALLPAFTLGFQRSAQNPNVFGQFLDLMGSGRYAPFYDSMLGRGSSAQSGQLVLDKLFGSPEMSRQIAAQASAATGIGTHVLQQMLPEVAAVLMGGMFRYATVEGFAGFLRAWADWLGRLGPPKDRPREVADAAGNLSDAWQNYVSTMFRPLGTSEPRKPDPPDPMAPWTDLVNAMTSGLPGGRPAAPPPPPPPPEQPNPLATLAQMFESGREAHAQHLANLQTVMSELWSARKPG